MLRGMVFAVRIAVTATALACVVLASLQSIHSPGPDVTPRSPSQTAFAVQTSLEPEAAVRGGTIEEHRRLAQALSRFASNGLLLPNLEVEFGDDVDACDGHIGHFQAGQTPWRVLICTTSVDSVYEHELAHAWELANLTDETRRDFMELRDFSTWADRGVPWNERGIEGVAVVIQQGLAGLPLPPMLSTEHQSRMEAFELLTDRPAPRLLDWCAAGREHRAQAAQVRGTTIPSATKVTTPAAASEGIQVLTASDLVRAVQGQLRGIAMQRPSRAQRRQGPGRAFLVLYGDHGHVRVQAVPRGRHRSRPERGRPPTFKA
jgi:hypothetical protein